MGKYLLAEMDSLLLPIRNLVDQERAADLYPSHWKMVRQMDRNVLHPLLSEAVQIEFANFVAGKSLEELDELAMSFHFNKCEQRSSLNETMASFAEYCTQPRFTITRQPLSSTS